MAEDTAKERWRGKFLYTVLITSRNAASHAHESLTMVVNTSLRNHKTKQKMELSPVLAGDVNPILFG